MIFTTGDTHGGRGVMDRFNPMRNRGGTSKDKDFVIILGDAGFIWCNEPDGEEKKTCKWLNDSPWTTLVVDGNHDNHDRFDKLPIEDKYGGGKVGKISDSIFHLRRGEVYEVDGVRIFTFGGAMSIDKEHRIVGLSWWDREIPSYAEMDHALETLERVGNKVDLVLTHTMPRDIIERQIGHLEKAVDPTTEFLQHLFETLTFKQWFCGHFHINQTFEEGRVVCLYEDIVKVGIDGK
jgi:hypothetical protein